MLRNGAREGAVVRFACHEGALVVWTEIVVRLGAAAMLGVGLGLNRYLHHKSIGVRTLGLVAVTAASLIVSLQIYADAAGVTRVIQGIVTGIGFIGAGLIMHKPDDQAVHGLTTATTVWVAAVVGMICGLGIWQVMAPAACIIGVLLLTGGKFEKAVARRFEKPDNKRDDPPRS